MIGRNIFRPGSFMHPHLQHYPLLIPMQIWQRWSMHVLNVLSQHSQIIAQTSTNSCHICSKDPQHHREKLQIPCCSNFKKGNDHMAWDETISAATPLHCLAMTLLPNLQNLQNVENDIVIVNGNVLGHAWHTWCKSGINGKKVSCSLLICHTKIFKLIDIRTMGLWIWITLFDTHCRPWFHS